nr:hypothetical protein [Candidatus Enterousia merdequi]
MNKKPGLLFAVCLLALVILAASFGMNFGGNPPVRLPQGVNPADVLYVCQNTDSSWTQFSNALHMFSKYATILFFFAFFILLFSWGWALYQNLLKDKFNEDAYKNSWALTKFFFWALIIYTVLFMTPNHFSRVDVRGDNRQWVLCENTSAGAHAVKSKAVTLH